MTISELTRHRMRPPCDTTNDYPHEIAAQRREFLRQQTRAGLSRVAQYWVDPAILPGNMENFVGAAQVRLGTASPLIVNGEHAPVDFYSPLGETSLAAAMLHGDGVSAHETLGRNRP